MIFNSRSLLWLVGLAVFFLNPALACTGDGVTDPYDYDFGEAEMKAAVEGTWTITTAPASGAATTLKVRLEQATGAATAAARTETGLVRAALACGSRTFVRPAGACIDITTMPLTGAVVEGDEESKKAVVKGSFMVAGLKYGGASLELHIGARRLNAEFGGGDTVWSVTAFPPEEGTIVMRRVQP